MARAITARNAYYDTQPVREYRRGLGAPLSDIFGFAMDCTRGACSGLLALLGASHIAAGQVAQPAIASADPVVAMLESVAAGGLTGPVELFAGVALFLSTRRGLARVLGLLAVLAMTVGYAKGYEPAELLGLIAQLLQTAAGGLEQVAATTS